MSFLWACGPVSTHSCESNCDPKLSKYIQKTYIQTNFWSLWMFRLTQSIHYNTCFSKYNGCTCRVKSDDSSCILVTFKAFYKSWSRLSKSCRQLWCSSSQLYYASPPFTFQPCSIIRCTEGDAASTESTIHVLFSAVIRDVLNPQSSFILTFWVHRSVCPPTPSAVFFSDTLLHKHFGVGLRMHISSPLTHEYKPFDGAYCPNSGVVQI